MHLFFKYGGLACIVFWGLVVLHIQIFFFRSFTTAKPNKLPGTCPFKAAKQMFCQPTAFIANSFFVMARANSVKSIAASGLVAHVDPQSWKRFHHIHELQPIPGRVQSPRCSYNPATPYSPHCYFTGVTLKATKDDGDPTGTIDAQFKKNNMRKDADALEVVVIGLSHHNSKVEMREKLAVPEDSWNAVSRQLISQFPESIKEASVISTCNRFEIYLAGPNQYEVIRDAIQFLSEYSNNALDTLTLRRNLFMLSGEDAIWHLLRVSAGLDSLIVGEGQILAQMKKCYERGTEGSNPPAGKVLSRMLNNAVAAGKRVRSETGISKGAVSISSAAAEFSSMKLEEDCGISDVKDAAIAVIGAGKMTRLLLTHLESQGIHKITVVNRSPERMVELQQEFPNLLIEQKLMNELWDVMQESDIVYTSTASQTPIIEPTQLQRMLQKRLKKSNLQLIDISVPRNVHQDCVSLDGVKSYNVDDLKAVVERNTAKRRREMVEAEGILKDELSKFRLWQQSLGAIPTIAKLQEKAEHLRQEEMLKAAKKLTALTSRDLEVVERVTKGIVAKLLHGPMSHLRQQTEGGDATRAAIEQVQLAFQLSA
jgi:glutamyl-tRNA reductase